MSENNDGFGMDILKGLKKVLFTSSAEEKKVISPIEDTRSPSQSPEPAKFQATENFSETAELKDVKLRVYQLLESMNKPGVDFFEVWNAAVEMGGPNSANIKSAFTSLKFADKSLTKAKLQETGSAYMSGLKTVIETESQKRLEEKNRLDKEREQVKSSLKSEITSLEQQIAVLQERLAAKKTEQDTINDKYDPKISEIDKKINTGKQSVNSVLSEMQQVLDIINKELN
jgi:hypothetical protein